MFGLTMLSSLRALIRFSKIARKHRFGMRWNPQGMEAYCSCSFKEQHPTAAEAGDALERHCEEVGLFNLL